MTGKDEVTPPASNSLSAMLEQGKSIEDIQKGLPEVHTVELKDVEKPVDRKEISKEPVYKPKGFVRGDVVVDLDRDVRVVVTRPSIGFSLKGVPFHRVVEKKTGENWIQKESRLKRV